MEQRPSREANGFSVSQETHRMLWNSKVHYSFHLSLSWTRKIHSMMTIPLLKFHF